MDIIARSALLVDFPDEVEKMGIHLRRLIAAPVAQEAVDLLQALGIVAAIALEGDRRFFLGVDEIELERARLACCLNGRRKARA